MMGGWIRAIAVLAIVMAFASGTVFGQAQPVKDACDLLPKATVPETDWPTLEQAYSADVPIKREGDPHASACDPVGLYYGGSAGHFEKARYCVLAQIGMIRGTADKVKIRAAQDAATGGATDPGPEGLEGLSGLVLAMVYANGNGVKRNLPLAKQFVCDYGGGIQSASPSDWLRDFDETTRANRRYDVCKDEGGLFGRSTTYGCQAVLLGKRSEEIERLERSIEAASSPKVKATFVGLRGAWQDYHDAYTTMSSAMCAGGTGCGVISQSDDLNSMEKWRTALRAVEQGKAPAAGASPSSFSAVDRQLNATYKQELDDYKPLDSDNCCTSQIREADRAWLAYREAWVRFGTARWPEIPADQWRAWQTVEWTSLLSER